MALILKLECTVRLGVMRLRWMIENVSRAASDVKFLIHLCYKLYQYKVIYDPINLTVTQQINKCYKVVTVPHILGPNRRETWVT